MIKANETSQSMSEMIDNHAQESLPEDLEDLSAFDDRAGEPLIAFETYLKEIERDGRI